MTDVLDGLFNGSVIELVVLQNTIRLGGIFPAVDDFLAKIGRLLPRKVRLVEQFEKGGSLFNLLASPGS